MGREEEVRRAERREGGGGERRARRREEEENELPLASTGGGGGGRHRAHRSACSSDASSGGGSARRSSRSWVFSRSITASRSAFQNLAPALIGFAPFCLNASISSAWYAPSPPAESAQPAAESGTPCFSNVATPCLSSSHSTTAATVASAGTTHTRFDIRWYGGGGGGVGAFGSASASAAGGASSAGGGAAAATVGSSIISADASGRGGASPWRRVHVRA